MSREEFEAALDALEKAAYEEGIDNAHAVVGMAHGAQRIGFRNKASALYAAAVERAEKLSKERDDALDMLGTRDRFHDDAQEALRAEVAALKAERDDMVNDVNRPHAALLRDVASLRAERDEWKQRAEATVELCSQGHYFGALHESHPRDGSGLRRCPHCMAAGIDVFKAERDKAISERDAAHDLANRHYQGMHSVAAERDALAAELAALKGQGGAAALYVYKRDYELLADELAAVREALGAAMQWGIELGTGDPEWVAMARQALARTPSVPQEGK